MSQAMRKLTAIAHTTNTMIIFTNQIRHKIGVMYGTPETTSGGNALKFYASIRLDIRRKDTIKSKEEIIGANTKVKVIKNKCAPPFKVAEFPIMYGKGIDKMTDVLRTAVSKGIVTKAGSWYSYKETQLGQGEVKTIAALEEQPEFLAEIIEKVK